jgi:hypothetical protein
VPEDLPDELRVLDGYGAVDAELAVLGLDLGARRRRVRAAREDEAGRHLRDEPEHREGDERDGEDQEQPR